MDKLLDQLMALEESLVHHDYSSTPEQLEALLAPDLLEQDGDGKQVERQQVLNWILNKPADYRWQFDKPTLKKLSEGAVMLSYLSRQIYPHKKKSTGSLRNSIWKFNPASQSWQLAYHQVTRLKK